MKYTKNYQFKKPDSDDPYDIHNENDNMDSIDETLKNTVDNVELELNAALEELRTAKAGPSSNLKKTRGHSNYFGGWEDHISAERSYIIGSDESIDWDIYWFEAVGWADPGTTLYVPY